MMYGVHKHLATIRTYLKSSDLLFRTKNFMKNAMRQYSTSKLFVPWKNQIHPTFLDWLNKYIKQLLLPAWPLTVGPYQNLVLKKIDFIFVPKLLLNTKNFQQEIMDHFIGILLSQSFQSLWIWLQGEKGEKPSECYSSGRLPSILGGRGTAGQFFSKKLPNQIWNPSITLSSYQCTDFIL
jgi:hypothetical protein